MFRTLQVACRPAVYYSPSSRSSSVCASRSRVGNQVGHRLAIILLSKAHRFLQSGSTLRTSTHEAVTPSCAKRNSPIEGIETSKYGANRLQDATDNTGCLYNVSSQAISNPKTKSRRSRKAASPAAEGKVSSVTKQTHLDATAETQHENTRAVNIEQDDKSTPKIKRRPRKKTQEADKVVKPDETRALARSRTPSITDTIGLGQLVDSAIGPLSAKPDELRFQIADQLLSEMKATSREGKVLGRVNILSERLCVDVLDRLGPSLDKHKGCDIIELNPGIGIWSTKLHDFLLPRSHIMFEPEPKVYQRFLEPLLNRKGTLLYPHAGHIWEHLEAVLTSKYLPYQEVLPEGDPRLDLPNDTLLFVANMAFNPRKSVGHFPSLANLLNYQLLSAVRTHSLFHRYGLIRMLVWMHELDRDALLPTSVSRRRPGAVHTEATCSSITEVAGPDVGLTRNRNRSAVLELESGRKVVQKMKENKVHVPDGRQNQLLRSIEEINAGRSTEEDFYGEYLSGDFQEAEDVFLKATGRRRKDEDGPDAVPLTQAAYNKFVNRRSIRRITLKLLDEFQVRHAEYIAAVEEREKALLLPTSEDGARKRRLEAVEARLVALEHWIESLQPRFHMEVPRSFDDKRALSLDPPLLFYDRRPYEPLKLYEEECHPFATPSLLDIEPRPLAPILRQDYPKNWEVFEHISETVRAGKTPVNEAISSLAPNAYAHLVEEGRCKKLQDPRFGGNRDLHRMSTRLLTQPMMEEMVETWAKWPFKPTRWEILVRQMADASDDDDLIRF